MAIITGGHDDAYHDDREELRSLRDAEWSRFSAAERRFGVGAPSRAEAAADLAGDES